MKRAPTRLPSARQSSSSAEVWWISSTTRGSRGDVAVLEPAAFDPRRHDHDIPARCFGCGLALAIDDTDAKVGGAQDRFGDRTNCERLAGARACDDAEALSLT